MWLCAVPHWQYSSDLDRHSRIRPASYGLSLERGEIRVTAPGPYIFSGMFFDGPVTIEQHGFATNEVKILDWDWPAGQKDLPLTARSVAGLYERYAEWVEKGQGEVASNQSWPRLEDGAHLMEEFQTLYKQYDPQWS